MRKSFFIFISLFSLISVFSQEQELNAVVTVNADKVQSTNKQVYKTLEKSLTEFINQTKWTNRNFLPQERINCAFTIIVKEQVGNQFKASLQVQGSRPVYNSSYTTPLLNINDTDFMFQYNEFQPLLYNPNSFESNLVSTIVFYVYVVLGMDADSFALKGGQEYLKKAEDVMLQAQQSGVAGWENKIGKQNRYALIDNLISSKFETFREIYYNYHRKGFDIFATDATKAKEEIEKSVVQLQELYNITIGNYMIRIFLDAKSDEIVRVFSDGKPTRTQGVLRGVLERISPTNRSKWKKIK